MSKSARSEGSSSNWDERKYRQSSKKKSNEEETRKLSVAPTATLKVNNERRIPKTVTDANFELASDMYIDKGPQISQTKKKSDSMSSFPSESSGNSPKSNSSRKQFRPDPKKAISPTSSNRSMGSQFTDTTYVDDDDSDAGDPNRSPDYHFFADQTIKLSRGVTAYKVIKPDNYDGSQPLRTIICLHGMMDSSYTFEDIVEVLSCSEDGPKAQVVVMDFYGHGRSPWSGFPCTLDIFVTQVQELLEALNLVDDGVDVLGYSLGGAVAIGFSVKFPHLCNSLCLIDPAGIRLKNPAKYRVLKRKFFGELTMMLRKSSMINEQLDLFYNTEFNTTHRPQIDKQMSMVAWQQKHTPGYLGAQLSLFRHFPLSGMADLYAVSGRRTERPVLFLWGNEDNLFPLRKALTVVENAYPTAEILSLIECGHNPIFEKFEDVAPAIIDFYRNSA
mmetsp:Transcript_7065/g.11837  ORF Transcript_7065/g.11837 Transcript_7065/m.11837 type:complete len:445 (-) Transcript_7065:357-1691(-)